MNCSFELSQLSYHQKDNLIIELWKELEQLRHENRKLMEENEELKRKVAMLEEQLKKPAKDSHNSSLSPSRDRKANKPGDENNGKKRREASVGRKGGGRELHPNPDQRIVARARRCPHCGEAVSEADQGLHAVYDKIEIPPVKPVVTRVEQYGGHCRHCGKEYVSPVPCGLEGGSPFWGFGPKFGHVLPLYSCDKL